MEDLFKMVEQDYEAKGNRSIASLRVNLDHLRSYWSEKNPDDATGSDVRDYILMRKQEKAKPSTINRELSTLRRAGNLGMADRLISRFPKITLLEEDNVRIGFVEHDEFEKVKEKLSTRYRRPYVFGYYFGWRMMEILSLRKETVEIDLGIIRLERRNSKSKKGRVIALVGEALEVVKASYIEHPESPFVFPEHNGEQISKSTFYVHTKMAFVGAGYPERFFHDLRRTAYRNLKRAGNHDKIAQETTGHRTRSIADRYDIVDENDMVLAAVKVQEYLNRVKSGNASESQGQEKNDGGALTINQKYANIAPVTKWSLIKKRIQTLFVTGGKP